jgi:hypothetical protein
MAVTINGTTGILAPDIGIDGTTLTVDAVNNRVGIGTTTPFGTLQVRPGTNANFSFSTGGGESSLEILNDAGSANVPLNVRASEYKIKIQGTEKLRITSDGDVSISSTGTVHGPSKLTVLPTNRTTAFSASDGTTWHDVVLMQGGGGANSAVGIAFELESGGSYHNNAGTGIAAVKNGNAQDYGSDLAFITRPQSAIAEERLRITSDGTLYTQGNAPINSSHHGAFVSYVPTSGTYAYKSIEIGSNVSSGSDTGSQIVSRAKNSSRLPLSILGSWDNNSEMTVYHGGGWGSASRPATRQLFYTTSYMENGATGLIRMQLHADGNLSIGDITPVDTRNTGGIHIQNSRGLSFKSNTSTADSRNWRIRNDDYEWGALDISVGQSNSDCGDSASDVVARFQKDGQMNLYGAFSAKRGSSAIMFTEHNNGAVIWMDGANGDISGSDYFNIMANNSQQLSFGYAGAENIKMNTTGQLYLGGYPHDHTVAGGSNLKLRAGAGAWGISLGMRASNNDYAYFGFTDMNGDEQCAHMYSQRTGSSTGTLVFGTNSGNAGSSDRLKIDSSGRVCISPSNHFGSASSNMALSIVNNGGTGGYPAIHLASVSTGGNTNSVQGMSIVATDANWNLQTSSGGVHGLGILTGNSSNSGNVSMYIRSDKKTITGPQCYNELDTATSSNTAFCVAGGGLSIGPLGNAGDTVQGGRYVLGWYTYRYSGSNSYAHLNTSLWGGGSPHGQSMYMMGGFHIHGYRYSGSGVAEEIIHFHNWGGNIANYSRTQWGSWNPGNDAYVNSSGYITLRLINGSYYGYVIDLIQHAWYPNRNITVTGVTYSNSSTI